MAARSIVDLELVHTILKFGENGSTDGNARQAKVDDCRIADFEGCRC